MFQVDIEKVMYATGVQKAPSSNKVMQASLEARERKAERRHEYHARGDEMARAKEGKGEEAAVEAAAEGPDVEGEGEGDGQAESESALPELSEVSRGRVQRESLKLLVKDIKKLLKSDGRSLSIRDRQLLRAFRSDAKRHFSRPELDAGELIRELQLQIKNQEVLAESFSQVRIREEATGAEQTLPEKEEPAKSDEDAKFNRQQQLDKTLDGLDKEMRQKAVDIIGDMRLSNEQLRQLKTLLLQDEENPVDESKPYATPWAPRPFMAAFAFIPRYLEVNHEICAAVYLRHPVARKGRAEVPTPFPYFTNQLAHNWYLQRG